MFKHLRFLKSPIFSALFILLSSATFASNSVDPFESLGLRHDKGYISDDLLLTRGAVTTTHLSQFTGQKIILYFWDLTCSDCSKQWQDILFLKNAAVENHVLFFPVFAGDPDQGPKAESFLSNLHEGFVYWIAAPGSARDQFLTDGLPAIYFVDSGNKILARANGKHLWSGHAHLDQLVQKIFVH